ncbi:hypothetical protein WDW37_11025 [Bdellovibrionota bacterium FG-1]
MLPALFTAAAIVTFYCAPVRADYDTGYQKFKSSYLDWKEGSTFVRQETTAPHCNSTFLTEWLGNYEEAKKFSKDHPLNPFSKSKLLASKSPTGGMTFGEWLDLHDWMTEIAEQNSKLLRRPLILQNAEIIPSGSELVLKKFFPIEWKVDQISSRVLNLETSACTPPLGLPLNKSLGAFGIENFTQIGIWPQPKTTLPITLKTVERQAQDLLKTWYRQIATEDPIESVASLERQLSLRLPATPENQSKIRLFTSFLLSHLGMGTLGSRKTRELGNPHEIGQAISDATHLWREWGSGYCDMIINRYSSERSKESQEASAQYEQAVYDAIRPIALAHLSHFQEEVGQGVQTLPQETRFFHYVQKNKRHDPKDPKVHEWIREFVTFRANQAMSSELIAHSNRSGDGLYIATEAASSREFGGRDPALYEIALKPGARILLADQVRLTPDTLKALGALGCFFDLQSLAGQKTPLCRGLFQKILRDLKVDLFHFEGPVKDCRYISDGEGDHDWLILVSPQNVDWSHTHLHTEEGSTSSEKHRRLIRGLSMRDDNPMHQLASGLMHVPVLGPLLGASPREIAEYKKKYQLGCQDSWLIPAAH